MRAHLVDAAGFVVHEARLAARMEHDEPLVVGACTAGGVCLQQVSVAGPVVATWTHPVGDPKPPSTKTEEVERSASVCTFGVDVDPSA